MPGQAFPQVPSRSFQSSLHPDVQCNGMTANLLPGHIADLKPVATARAFIAAARKNLDAQGEGLLREDLRSSCTEEGTMFHAFSRIVAEARCGSGHGTNRTYAAAHGRNGHLSSPSDSEHGSVS
jgi:hypothetical protein